MVETSPISKFLLYSVGKKNDLHFFRFDEAAPRAYLPAASPRQQVVERSPASAA
jgi:hypothetical protein